MYITYEEYKSLGGTLDEAAFYIYGYDADREIKAQTHDRITTPSEAVKRCIVRVTDLMSKADIGVERVTSFNHDGLSQNFAAPTADEYAGKINDIIYTYLIGETADDGTPLLYRGVD